MRLTILALTLGFTLFLAAPADAQHRRDRDADAFGEAGAFALSFSAGWLAVGPFLGGAGGRYWLTDRAVLTASLRAGVATTDLDPTSDPPRPDEERDAYQLGLGVAVERHFGRSRRVSPFVALGADFTVTRSEDEVVFPEGGGVESSGRAQAVGAALFVGAEYRFAPGLTLAAAHSLGATYEWGENVQVRDLPETEPERIEHDHSAFRFGTSTTTLTRSVYF